MYIEVLVARWVTGPYSMSHLDVGIYFLLQICQYIPCQLFILEMFPRIVAGIRAGILIALLASYSGHIDYKWIEAYINCNLESESVICIFIYT